MNTLVVRRGPHRRLQHRQGDRRRDRLEAGLPDRRRRGRRHAHARAARRGASVLAARRVAARARTAATSSSTRRRCATSSSSSRKRADASSSSPYGDGDTALVQAARAAGCAVIDGREALVAAGRRERSSAGPAYAGACERHAHGFRLACVTLDLASAGESHGPALVAILSGLPAGLTLDREAIDADLRRRQQGYGRSPRQQIETDEVEVLAGLRQGRTLGTPLALVVRNRDHKNWTWGMNPWPLRGRAGGQGHEGGHAASARPCRPRGRAEVRAARRPRRARARIRAPHCGARRCRRRREGAARAHRHRGRRATRCPRRERIRRRSTRRVRIATRSAASSRCARPACRRASARTRARTTGSTHGSPRR